MQNRRDSRSRLNSAAQHMLTNNTMATHPGDTMKKTDLQGKIEELQMELQQKDVTIAALQRNYDGMSMIYKNEKGKSAGWDEKVAGLEKENNALRSKIGTFEVQKQKAMQELEKTQEELMKLLKGYEEIRALKTENATNKALLEKKRKEADEYYTKMETFRAESEALRKVKIDLDAVIKKLKGDLDSENKDKKKILSEYEDYKENTCKLESQYADLLNEYENFKNESSKKSNSDIANEAQIQSLKQQIKQDRSEFTLLKAKHAELTTLYNNLKDQLEIQEAKSKTSEKRLNDIIKEITDKNFVLLNDNQKLKEQLENSADLAKLVKNYEEKINNANFELESKNKELEKWKNEAKGLTESLNKVFEQSKKTSWQLEEDMKLESARSKNLVSEKEQIIDMLARREEEYKDYLRNKDKSLNDCRISLENLSKTIENLTNDNKRLKEDFQDTQQLYVFTKKSLQQSLEDNIKLKEALAGLLKEVENLKNKLFEESSSKAKMQDKSSEFTSELNQKSQMLLQKDQRIQELINELYSIRKHNSELTDELGVASSSISDLKNLIKSIESAHSTALETIKKTENSLETSEKEKKTLTLQLNSSKTELEKCKNIISNLSSDISILKQDLNNIKDTKTKLEIQISAKDMDIASMSQALMIEKSNYKNSMEDNKNLVKRLQEIKDDRDRMKALDEENQKKGKILIEKEKSLAKVLEKVENALNSLETNLICHSCFGNLENAVVCVPCGHLNCKNCRPAVNESCKECDGLVRATVPVSRFDEIFGKIVYKKQAIQDMKHILNP